MSYYPALSQSTRQILNRIDGTDENGIDLRFKFQAGTWLVGAFLEISDDRTIKRIGTTLRIGAEDSFIDYVAEKIANWLRQMIREFFNQ